MRSFFLLVLGIFTGIYLSWPGIINSKNWKCLFKIIEKSSEDEISFKTVLEISPSYFIKSRNRKMPSKIRIIADACFR
ncbi:hypothetical protein [uncultured Prochlorococcus sp.]|uniref:hypothetical protein n=1 Tax=uncultured Prochlorococcus sp. TaxID=159733 RepID=UPI002591226C|nr:hypothetical protein [uncultured Prochlorococcus sp.]